MDIGKYMRFEHMQREFEPTDNAGNALPQASLSCVDFGESDALKQKESRPLKADGQAGLIAQHLLGRHVLTIQTAITLLYTNGHVSNDPGRRVREARAWLERNGIKVMTFDCIHEKTGTRHQAWQIENDAELQHRLMNKLKGIK